MTWVKYAYFIFLLFIFPVNGWSGEVQNRPDGGTIAKQVTGTELKATPDVFEKKESVSGKSQPRQMTNDLGMVFQFIPPGSFLMGSPANELQRHRNESQHRVTFSKGFYMQATEVTQKQWKAVMGDNPSQFKECGEDCPVEMVSWNEIQVFLEKLNNLEKSNRYRLPTEAEWEYAARAGTTTPFSFGDCLKTDQASYNGTIPTTGCPKGKSNKSTRPVASFPPNAWGLYDMHGNVWEWCQDWYGKYPPNSVVDPTGPKEGTDRINRGGGWSSRAGSCRSASRYYNYPDYWENGVGFRLVYDPPKDESGSR